MSTRRAWRTAIVTGAASGIGRCFAETLAAQGTAVGLLDVAADALQSAAGTIRASGRRVETGIGDVSDAVGLGTAVDALVSALGGVDLVVHCAAILGPGHFAEQIRKVLCRK